MVPLIPSAALHKVDLPTHRSLFAEQEEVVMEDGDGDEAVDKEVIAGKDMMIPFPQDWVGSWVGVT